MDGPKPRQELAIYPGKITSFVCCANVMTPTFAFSFNWDCELNSNNTRDVVYIFTCDVIRIIYLNYYYYVTLVTCFLLQYKWIFIISLLSQMQSKRNEYVFSPMYLRFLHHKSVFQTMLSKTLWSTQIQPHVDSLLLNRY